MVSDERLPGEDPYAWLQALKAGDTVALPGYHGNPPTILRVERVTKTQIICEGDQRFRRGGDQRFRRGDGGEVGAYDRFYGRNYLYRYTPAVDAKIELYNLKLEVAKLRDNLTTPQTATECRALIAALKPFVKEEPK